MEENMTTKRKIRVLIAKPGLDGHDRGALFIARALKNAGMEVIYTGIHYTPKMVVEAAIQEDVDVIGVSILSGAHTTIFEKIFRFLKEKKAEDIPVIAGGTIPPDDAEELKKMGVRAVFLPGTDTADVIRLVEKIVH
jgi:methylmalonyl-CoA mutase C-terminal domain/subunit